MVRKRHISSYIQDYRKMQFENPEQNVRRVKTVTFQTKKL